MIPAERETPAGEAMREAVAQIIREDYAEASRGAPGHAEHCADLVCALFVPELARLTDERDEAQARAELWGDWIADAYELLNDACMTTDADDSVEPGIIAATRRACAALTTQRADHAAEVARLTEALEPLWQRARAPGADRVPGDGTVTVFMSDCRNALNALAPKETTDA